MLRQFPPISPFLNCAAANFAALPTANAAQYATSHCKPLLFWFPCKRRYIKSRHKPFLPPLNPARQIVFVLPLYEMAD